MKARAYNCLTCAIIGVMIGTEWKRASWSGVVAFTFLAILFSFWGEEVFDGGENPDHPSSS